MIVPAEKLPLPSRLTIALAVLALVAASVAATLVFSCVWLFVIAPAMFGNVARIVALTKRMWLSPSPTLSELVGLVLTKPFIKEADSSAII